MDEEIKESKYEVVYTTDNTVFINDGKLLLQHEERGDLIYIPQTKTVCAEFNITIPTCNNEANAEEIEYSSVDESDSNTPHKMWTREATIFLITAIEEHYERDNFNKDLKKNLWLKIAKQCSEKFNRIFAADHVESKWKSLKRTYKSILLNNNGTGRKRRHWEFFDLMNNFMHSLPEITPKATCSSISGLIVNAEDMESKITKQNVEGENLEQHKAKQSREDALGESSFSRKRKDRNNAVVQRHNEKMARMDRFNDLFDQMVKKMPAPPQ